MIIRSMNQWGPCYKIILVLLSYEAWYLISTVFEGVVMFYKIEKEIDWFSNQKEGNPVYNAWLNLPITLSYVYLIICKISCTLGTFGKHELTHVLYASTMTYSSSLILLIPDFMIKDYNNIENIEIKWLGI